MSISNSLERFHIVIIILIISVQQDGPYQKTTTHSQGWTRNISFHHPFPLFPSDYKLNWVFSLSLKLPTGWNYYHFFSLQKRVTTGVKPSFCRKANFVNLYMTLPKTLSCNANNNNNKTPKMWGSISASACWCQIKRLNQIKVIYCLGEHFLVWLSLRPWKLSKHP